MSYMSVSSPVAKIISKDAEDKEGRKQRDTALTLDRSELDSLVIGLRELAEDPQALALAELLQSLRNAMAHHGRVAVHAMPLDRRSLGAETLAELRQSFEELIVRMTPELLMPTEAEARQARRNAEARTQLLQEFGAFTGEQIAEERSIAQNRHALAARWRKEGRLFGVPYQGQTVYPAFQFDANDQLRSVVQDVLALLPREGMSDWEVALWWTAANGWLAGRRPVDLLGEEPEALVDAARRLAQPSPL